MCARKIERKSKYFRGHFRGTVERIVSRFSNEPIANGCISPCQGGNEFFLLSSLLCLTEGRWITQKWSAPFSEKKGEKYANIRCYVQRGRKSWSPSFFLFLTYTRPPFERPKYIQSRSRLSFITFHFISLRQSVVLCFAVGTNSSSSSSSFNLERKYSIFEFLYIVWHICICG